MLKAPCLSGSPQLRVGIFPPPNLRFSLPKPLRNLLEYFPKHFQVITNSGAQAPGGNSPFARGFLWYFHCISNGFSLGFRFEICEGGVDPPADCPISDFHKLSPFLSFSNFAVVAHQIWALNSKYSSRYISLKNEKKKAFFFSFVAHSGTEPLIYLCLSTSYPIWMDSVQQRPVWA